MTNSQIVFAFDIGGTRTKYGLVDITRGNILATRVEPTALSGLSPMLTAADIVLNELCHEVSVERTAIIGAGVGIPGYVDDDLISLVWPSLAFLEGRGFRTELESILGIPVRFENDARVVALGETWFGGHQKEGTENVDRLLSLTLGTGLGFGMVIDGELLERGSLNHMAGHIPLRPGARPCFCGFSGCLESLVSAGVLQERLQAIMNWGSEAENTADVRDLFTMAASGHRQAQRAIDVLVEDLTLGLNGYIYLYAPDVIVLGGGLAQQLAPWLPQIQQSCFARPHNNYRVTVHLSELKELAGLYGAASLWKGYSV